MTLHPDVDAPSRRLTRRLVQMLGGLVLYGVSMALMVRSSLGNMPWDVLHEVSRTGSGGRSGRSPRS